MTLIDKQLIAKVLDGEEGVFAEIVKVYLKPVYNFVYRLAGDRDVADDLTQETFVKAWKNLARFDQNKNFRTWLFTIAKNTAFDYFKKKKEIPFSTFTDEEGDNWLENISGDEILPDEIMERANLAEELENILQKLPPHYRAILLLHYKEDFSLHEIAEILDEPYNTIKSRHQRGMGNLKELLAK
ncbi:MAG TPA: sigma-70 family RNA polymerase sigma factor [Candidatus Bathyarchaeia archaeon]|nr:sigma-70 family RNA polymerase sigma factor [Candidatus Bathyarchaeia archaeon]